MVLTQKHKFKNWFRSAIFRMVWEKSHSRGFYRLWENNRRGGFMVGIGGGGGRKIGSEVLGVKDDEGREKIKN
jgi:hypothetical protein